MHDIVRGLGIFSMIAVIATSCNHRPASVSPFQGFVGTWALKLGEQTLLIVTIEDEGGRLSGKIRQPKSFQITEGLHFSHITLPVKDSSIIKGVMEGGKLKFTAVDSSNKQDTDDYEMILDGANQALLQPDAPVEPWPLVKSVNSDAHVSENWNLQRVYSPEDNLPSNDELAKIVDEDQAARKDLSILSDPIALKKLDATDAERRNTTRRLLESGKLHTGEDFSRASLIFQHGTNSNDFLLAHSLAMTAAAKGDGGAIWMSAATLDRYLRSIGQPQVYGTQFTPGENPSLQEPFDRKLLTDTLRRELEVPSLSSQQEKAKQMVERMKAPSK